MTSPDAISVTGVAGPPAEGIVTRKVVLPLCATTMLSSLHAAPANTAERSINGTSAPPSTDILYSFRVTAEANPSQRPSGEKNGPTGLSVPGSSMALG